ncbi:MAG: four-carbon acid sugar kinase family protein [Gammaproteobacteria bacterium]|nr:four-carbon acid sugar kinase family protein [Gammaproteobacteria bacterium]
MTVLLGCIADDFTGATDLANTLVKQGMRTVLTIGVPTAASDLGDADALVVALKSRTSPVADAVNASVAALEWLRGLGAQQFFFKYCSTFDSTPNGNIGPVADALLDALGADFALVCPAFPANARTVRQGHLYVGEQLLSDSSMKDHPLTPMRDSDLVKLMGAQCQRRVGLVPHTTVTGGTEATAAAFESLRAAEVSYGVVDALTNHHLETIGAAASEHRLVTGASGVALGLPENFRRRRMLGPPAASEVPAIKGRAAVLAGSCSEATHRQIDFAKRMWPHQKLDAHRIAAQAPVVDQVLSWAQEHANDKPVLIYSSTEPDEVAAIQDQYGRQQASEMIENAFARIAAGLVANGVRRIVVAGGETSGAVVSALNVQCLRIGAEIDPGVPWTETLDEPRIALALKSGNFGSDDFFDKAISMLP